MVYSKIIPALLAAAVLATAGLAAPAAAQKAATRHPARTKASKSGSGVSGAWRGVYSDASVKVAVDTTQTRRSADGTYRVRLRWQYPTNQMIGTKHAYRTMIDQKMIDCGTKGIKPISARTYDANGKPVAGYDTPDSEVAEIDWAKRPPESSAGKAYAAVCGTIR